MSSSNPIKKIHKKRPSLIPKMKPDTKPTKEICQKTTEAFILAQHIQEEESNNQDSFQEEKEFYETLVKLDNKFIGPSSSTHKKDYFRNRFAAFVCTLFKEALNSSDTINSASEDNIENPRPIDDLIVNEENTVEISRKEPIQEIIASPIRILENEPHISEYNLDFDSIVIQDLFDHDIDSINAISHPLSSDQVENKKKTSLDSWLSDTVSADPVESSFTPSSTRNKGKEKASEVRNAWLLDDHDWLCFDTEEEFLKFKEECEAENPLLKETQVSFESYVSSLSSPIKDKKMTKENKDKVGFISEESSSSINIEKYMIGTSTPTDPTKIDPDREAWAKNYKRKHDQYNKEDVKSILKRTPPLVKLPPRKKPYNNK